jgi:hypothetical protein
MSQDAIIRTNAFDKLAIEASQGENIGENIRAMKEAIAAAMAANPSAASGDSSVPAAHQFKYEREVRWHESTGRRPMVIRADTIEDLNALERQVTGG